MTPVRRRYVDLAWGQLHLREAGHDAPGLPLVLLHQTPRSGDEFAEVLVRLSGTRPVLAPDLPGMGGSDALPEGASVEGYARAVLALLAALDVGRAHLLGHHTGAAVAVETAAQAPAAVASLTLSSCPWVDVRGRERRRGGVPVDHVEPAPDGAHLQELWQQRRRLYPPDRPELLARYIRDAVAADDPAAGHRAVAAYRMEDRAPLVRCPVLQLTHGGDPFAAADADDVTRMLAPAERVDIPSGSIPLELAADNVAAAVQSFLTRFG